jgi:hypothetical protein
VTEKAIITYDWKGYDGGSLKNVVIEKAYDVDRWLKRLWCVTENAMLTGHWKVQSLKKPMMTGDWKGYDDVWLKRLWWRVTEKCSHWKHLWCWPVTENAMLTDDLKDYDNGSLKSAIIEKIYDVDWSLKRLSWSVTEKAIMLRAHWGTMRDLIFH